MKNIWVVFFSVVSVSHQVNIESYDCTIKKSHNLNWTEKVAFLKIAQKAFHFKDGQSKNLFTLAIAAESQCVFGTKCEWKVWIYRIRKSRGGGIGLVAFRSGAGKLIQIEKSMDLSYTFVVNLNE